MNGKRTRRAEGREPGPTAPPPAVHEERHERGDADRDRDVRHGRSRCVRRVRSATIRCQLVVIGRRLHMPDAAGDLDHLAAGLDRDIGEIGAGRPQFLQEDAGEDRVRVLVGIGQPVERALLGAGGEQDEHAAVRRHLREAAAAADRAPPARREGIVAAGVEHGDDGSGTLGAEGIDQFVGRKGLPAHERVLPLLRRRNVDREQIVAVVDLDAVPGEEEEHRVARLHPALELRQRRGHRVEGGVLDGHHLVEAEIRQGTGDAVGVVARLLQLVDARIDVVADDEAELRRRRGRAEAGEQQRGAKQSRQHVGNSSGRRRPVRF